MKHKVAISVLTAGVLALTSVSVFAQGMSGGSGARDRAQPDRSMQSDRDFDRDRLRDRDRVDEPSRDRDRDQDRTHAPDFAKLSDQDIYGNEVMNVQERNEYRSQLQNAATTEERQQIEAQHRDMVQARAETRGVSLASPGQGIYGGAIMSVEERNQYREQIKMIDSDEERLKFMAQHREEMQMRAQRKGVDVDDLAETEEAE
jgi:hypothetical protein